MYNLKINKSFKHIAHLKELKKGFSRLAPSFFYRREDEPRISFAYLTHNSYQTPQAIVVAGSILVVAPDQAGFFLYCRKSLANRDYAEANFDTLRDGTFPLPDGERFSHRCPGWMGWLFGLVGD